MTAEYIGIDVLYMYNFSNFLFYNRIVKSLMLSVCVGETFIHGLFSKSKMGILRAKCVSNAEVHV